MTYDLFLKQIKERSNNEWFYTSTYDCIFSTVKYPINRICQFDVKVVLVSKKPYMELHIRDEDGEYQTFFCTYRSFEPFLKVRLRFEDLNSYEEVIDYLTNVREKLFKMAFSKYKVIEMNKDFV